MTTIYVHDFRIGKRRYSLGVDTLKEWKEVCIPCGFTWREFVWYVNFEPHESSIRFLGITIYRTKPERDSYAKVR